jgi:CspA family cold shock protein
MTGTVKKIVADKGFGFIKADDGKEYFFHRSAVQGDFDSLKGGEKVEFDATTGPKGPRAENVKLVA